MPRKQKTAKKTAENREGTDNGSSAAKTEITPPDKSAKKTRTSKPAARKSAVPRKSRTNKAPAASHSAEPSADQIQLRAYFISEHRQRVGMPGDHHSDWLEARRQLIIEARSK